jgi:histidyl-tRNA synthetase
MFTNQKKPVKKEKEAKPSAFQSPKGMHDILPSDWPFWDKAYKATKDVADFYNFSRIETPILENVDLFIRGVGEATDIVEKEMFVFKTKGGDKLALRPEFTASVVRSYLENGLHRLPQPLKLYYFGPVFRHEKPQAGRYRQFNQLGFEILGGEGDPIYDSQVIISAYRFLEELKAKNLMVQVNSIGCRVCRPNYKKKLVEYYKNQDICKECDVRLGKNPFRLLDCKNEVCQLIKLNAPSILDSLCVTCKKHFKETLEYLDEVNIPYTLNPYLVRGLDYYNRTVFEIFREGSDLAIAGGGRYDYLSEMLGGKPTPATGVSIGLERVVEMLKADLKDQQIKVKPKIFLVHVGEMTKKRALLLIEEFRKANMPIMETLGKDSLSAQLERAGKMNSPFALILGQKEAYEGSIILRDMSTGVQESIPLSKIVEEIKRRL